MAELKTRPRSASVAGFLAGIGDETRRRDCAVLTAVMKRVTGAPPKMWGGSIVGFGSYRYRYDSGREGEWFLTGFSPRKQYLAIYIMAGVGRYSGRLKKLGPHRTGRSCLYLKSLTDVHLPTLEGLISDSVERVEKRHR